MLSYYRHRTIVVSSPCCRVIVIVLSCFHHPTIVISSSYYRIIIIVVSRFHHRTIVVSSSYYRIFTIVLSCSRHRGIVFSPSYYRSFTIVLSPSGAHAHISLRGISYVYKFMKEELKFSQSTTYLNVPNMCRGQYKMCPNRGDLSLKGEKSLLKEGKLQATRILSNSNNLFKTLFL